MPPQRRVQLDINSGQALSFIFPLVFPKWVQNVESMDHSVSNDEIEVVFVLKAKTASFKFL